MSLTAWQQYGLPHTPAYCATKAALRNWGGAMRGWLKSEGIRVNVILPGYVDSPMCREMPGPKPFLWTPERA
ncbi:MAG: SDR family NAD(P)-dependent oxidoreductase, partial [Treponemataceae bacterium]|nr:SDR family NAD(P)-dependent oxidoreductase [Treponemataceae bacterium]